MANYADSVLDVILEEGSVEADLSVYKYSLIPLTKIIPEKFLQVPLILDLVATIYKVFVHEIKSLSADLRNVRNPRTLDIEFAEKFAINLGFYQDITFRDDDAKRRIIELLPKYYESQGTEFTFDFLSFIAQENLTLIPLYSTGHFNLVESPSGGVVPDGPWFLTSVVDLQYSAAASVNNSDILQKFYQVAPVPLLLRSIAALANFSRALECRGVIHIEQTVNCSTVVVTIT